jgi:hypothetical protein
VRTWLDFANVPLDKICKIGKVKPAVFPVPVCAAAITSLPCNTAGIACS